MDPRELFRLASQLIREKNFAQAEKLLLHAKDQGDNEGDTATRDRALSELIELYCIGEPPQVAKAAALSGERERLTNSAYSKLQTAMILHHGARDLVQAIQKLNETLTQGKDEGDDRTIYTALSMLGQANLELGHTEQALRALDAIEHMVASRGKFIVGDETSFLEGLRARQLEPERVARLASILAPACRDARFKERLKALSER